MATTQTNPGTSDNGSTQTAAEPKGNPVTRQVFDLVTFEKLDLEKPFTDPPPVTSVAEAIEKVGGDEAKFLQIVNDGLRAAARKVAYDDITGFTYEDGDGKDVPYTGTFASTDKLKLINNMTLNMAKAFSGGMWDSATLDQKKAWKKQAYEMVRNNEAMLKSLQS